MYIPWSEGNFILLIIVLLTLIYTWFKQPFIQLEKLLRERTDMDAQIEAISNALLEVVILTDDNGMILTCNHASERVLGYTSGELVGTNIINIIPARYKQYHLDGMKALKEGSIPKVIGKSMDVEAISKSGELIPIGLSLNRAQVSGKMLYIGVLRDVRERRQAEEQIKQLNLALETRLIAAEAFNRSVSHDLNAPLRSIDGFSEALLEDYGSKFDDKGRQFLIRIRAGVFKMRQLIKDMMRLAIVTQPGTEQLHVTQVSLSNMWKTIASEYKMTDPQRQVSVEIPDDMNVNVDPDLFALVISNLFDNAWKYTSKNKDTKITIGYKMVGTEKVYFISDNGVGFDQSKVDKLFQPFSRLHTQQEFEGSGIGLTIVKRVIDLHHGKVWAEGVVGQGAVFHFTIGT